MKKIVSLAALWLLLIALVFVYTDRDEYTWRIGGGEIGGILLSEEQAQENEAQAQAAMQAAQAEAGARTARGEWGEADQYDGAPITRGAMDGEPGLNLMWGEYEATVSYASAQPLALRVVSAGRQSFIRDGQFELEAGENTISFSFTLTDAAEHVALACDLPDGAQIAEIVIHKAGAGVFSRDLAAYALLAGVLLTVLLVLSWDERPVGRERRRDALAVMITALFASMPLLWRGVYDGHDLFFHLNRIEGIAAGLRAGQFPVRIHASTLLGYGYASPAFYPELFLYVPAALRNFGVSLAASVRVFEMAINLLTAASSYFCARRLFGDRRTALGAGALYTLCIYRLANLYVRAALGEILAMIFLPLLLAALYEVLTRDENQWPLLALAMTCIFMSHLLSTLFAAGLCVLAALICLPRLVREPRRILACAKAALATALCSVWFLVPLLDYTAEGVSTSVALMSADHVLRLGSYLVGFAGEVVEQPKDVQDFAYSIGLVPGLAIMLGCALLAVRLYAQGKIGGEERKKDRLALAMLCVGGVIALCATALFPWAWACSLSRPFSTLFMQIQFPWRLVGFAAPMLSMAAAWGYMRSEKQRTAGLCAAVVLSMIFSAYTMQIFVQKTPVLEKESYCDTRIVQYEYTYASTEKAALNPGEIIAADAQRFAVSDYEKQGTNLSFTLEAEGGCAYVEVPLLYYKGYRAQADGEELRVARGENNVVRLYGVRGEGAAQIRIWFEAPALWLAAQAVSACGAVLLAALLLCMKAGKRT